MQQRRQRAIERTEDCRQDTALKRGQRAVELTEAIEWHRAVEGTEGNGEDRGH